MRSDHGVALEGRLLEPEEEDHEGAARDDEAGPADPAPVDQGGDVAGDQRPQEGANGGGQDVDAHDGAALVLEEEVRKGQLHQGLGAGLGGADEQLVPDDVLCFLVAGEPDGPDEGDVHADQEQDAAAVQPGHGAGEQRPVADADEEHAGGRVLHRIVDAEVAVHAVAAGAGVVGRGRGEGRDEQHQGRMPVLAPPAPVERVVGRLGGKRDELDMLAELSRGLVEPEDADGAGELLVLVRTRTRLSSSVDDVVRHSWRCRGSKGDLVWWLAGPRRFSDPQRLAFYATNALTDFRRDLGDFFWEKIPMGGWDRKQEDPGAKPSPTYM